MQYFKDGEYYIKYQDGNNRYGFVNKKYITPAIYKHIRPNISYSVQNDFVMLTFKDDSVGLCDKSQMEQYQAKTPGKQGLKFVPIPLQPMNFNMSDNICVFPKKHNAFIYNDEMGKCHAIYKDNDGNYKQYDFFDNGIIKAQDLASLKDEDYMVADIRIGKFEKKCTVSFLGQIILIPSYDDITFTQKSFQGHLNGKTIMVSKYGFIL